MEGLHARGPLGVLVALQEELRAVEPALSGMRAVCGLTGMGTSNARAGTAEFIEKHHPPLLVATGFAGGLRAGLAAGDVLIAASVEMTCGERGSWSPLPALLEAAAAIPVHGFQARQGRLVTVEKLISSTDEKARLAAELNADGVDMESGGILEAAAARGVPVLCVRAIVDDFSFELPLELGRLVLPDGRPRLLRIAGAVLARPGSIPGLLALRAHARSAARSLTVFIPRLVEKLGEAIR